MYVLIALGYWAEGPVAGVDEGYAMAGESVAGEQYRGNRDLAAPSDRRDSNASGSKARINPV